MYDNLKNLMYVNRKKGPCLEVNCVCMTWRGKKTSTYNGSH